MFKNEDLKEIVSIDFGISKIFKNETTKSIGLSGYYEIFTGNKCCNLSEALSKGEGFKFFDNNKKT